MATAASRKTILSAPLATEPLQTKIAKKIPVITVVARLGGRFAMGPISPSMATASSSAPTSTLPTRWSWITDSIVRRRGAFKMPPGSC